MNRGIAATGMAALIDSAPTRTLHAVGAARTPARLISHVRGRYRSLTLVGAVAVAVLAIQFAHPSLYAAPRLQATLETVMAFVALVAAVLLGIRFMYSRLLSDFLLLGAVLTLGLTYVCAYLLPLALDSGSRSWLSDTAMWGGALTAALFAAAALASPAKLFDDVRRPIVAIVTAGLAVAVLGAWLLHGPLSDGARNGIARAPQHPLAVALALVGAALFVHAAISFTHAERRERSDHTLLSAALILLAAAQLSRLALPGLRPDDIALSDPLRFFAAIIVLVAAIGQAVGMQAAAARAASLEERRRVARDLHDGLAQDLAFIASYSERIAEALGPEHPVVVAARRALLVSRSTIADLSDPPGASAEQALDTVADELRHRFEIEIAVDVQLDREPPTHVREHLSRIAREAITNAVKHGRASAVVLTLKHVDGGTTLCVRDDGCGILTATTASRVEAGSGGFGLSSMRERAAVLGGSLSVRQTGPRGTVLEVVLP